MDNQKIENLLNLSLDATVQEREKSEILNVGYNRDNQTWELIVKYHGDLQRVSGEVIQVEPLIPGYAIVTLPEALIDSFAKLEEVEYIEKPKRLFSQVASGKAASCLLEVTLQEPYLTGKGTIVAVIDSGIAYEHMDFRNSDGSTRILELWDQTVTPNPEKGWAPPAGFQKGTLFSREQINRALQESGREGMLGIVPSVDVTGHGTAVTGIAAGNGAVQDGRYAGAAPESELLIVKLGVPESNGFPRTTELMRALSFVVNRGNFYGKPVSVNLSFGNTYGAHNGTSLLERFIDNVVEIGRTVLSVGSGNEGAAGGHVSGSLKGEETVFAELSVAEYERTLSVQLWKNYNDIFVLVLRAPDGSEVQISMEQPGKEAVQLMDTMVLLYVGEPSPYATSQELFFDYIPIGTYVDSGIWTFRMIPLQIASGEYAYYLPAENILNERTRFYRPTPETTLTIPSTAQKVITVGAYNTMFDSYADFSGRGYVDRRYTLIETGGNGVKPDLTAPGVSIAAPSLNGGYESFTGTSFAAPFVTGSAALLMEWGIVRGNDPYLYGEKVKAYFIRGARQLPGLETPNPMTGWGALCVRDSLPG